MAETVATTPPPRRIWLDSWPADSRFMVNCVARQQVSLLVLQFRSLNITLLINSIHLPSMIYNFDSCKRNGPSQWPRDLRRGSAAACLLGLRVRIVPGVWMSIVSVVSCQVEVCPTADPICRGVLPSVCVCVCVSVIKCNNNPLTPTMCR
jgi:hypothetical protein